MIQTINTNTSDTNFFRNNNGNAYILKIEHLAKYFGGNKSSVNKMLKNGLSKNDIFKKTKATVAINNVSFNVKKGEIYVLIGLSGSGKSTVIRCLNGLIKPTSGKIIYKNENIADFSKEQIINFRRHKISMVFQNFGLMDHKNVLENVTFGLEIRGTSKKEREEKGMEIINMVGLSGWERESIKSLSGGMRQRVGIARALTNDPEILLMDEPFSALDPLVRNDMQYELLELQEKLNKTVVFITHDINEAFKLGNTISIMKDGSIIQTDTPELMAEHPADEYVKNFIDSADKTKVFSAENIMISPSCIIHAVDGPLNAIKQMNKEEVSSAYVIGEKTELIGIITIDNALKLKNKLISVETAIKKDIITAKLTTPISELIPLAAKTMYPIAVVDEKNHLKGIITRTAVLASIS